MPKKKYGQNFLINEEICNKILNSENIKNKNILEIGPGNMALTKNIIKKKPKKFFAIEIDSDLVKKNENTIYSKYLKNKNALEIDEIKLFQNEKFSIISNLPFNISVQLLLKWINVQNKFNCIESMTLMFQKELADRIIATHNSKKYGRVSIITSAFFKVEKKIYINKNNFYPIPKVDAVVLNFFPHKKNKIAKNNLNKLEKITSFFFNHRRKKNIHKINKLFSEQQIKKHRLDKFFSMRAENLDKETYYLISEIL